MTSTRITVTSERVIEFLKKDKGFHLTFEDREHIREIINTALEEAAEWQSNDCDCGQMNCIFCHG